MHLCTSTWLAVSVLYAYVCGGPIIERETRLSGEGRIPMPPASCRGETGRRIIPDNERGRVKYAYVEPLEHDRKAKSIFPLPAPALASRRADINLSMATHHRLTHGAGEVINARTIETLSAAQMNGNTHTHTLPRTCCSCEVPCCCMQSRRSRRRVPGWNGVVLSRTAAPALTTFAGCPFCPS
ncbi:hypothetical protein FN846DRAFT_345363 [Sphaerosporella brunnea]|uniref:Secreted protein n=1 Tax=Sphaerosporella brunnea TaxID=1250544 RepID=A0A5J5EIK7_9PEZI|nr:hypothetical protein FN846DRAFT_345363 [Sphaerosporella brunnea]